MPTSIVVIDDQEIIRHGLASLFHGSPIRIVAEAADVEAGIKAVRKHKPDVVLLDVRIGGADGLEAIGRIQSASSDSRVVVLSAFDRQTYIARAIAAGVHDYVLKAASRAEIIEAITGAAAGAKPARSSVVRKVAGTMADKSVFVNSEVQLTPRESQVLRLIAMGLANREIAESLQISIETVKEHVQNLLRKMSVDDRTQAAVWAIRHGVA